MENLDLPIHAATEFIKAHGITPDRCDILQNGSTLVLRLTETLVARVLQDRSGPRQGTEWFARENAIAQHLTGHQAPVIPLHSELPAGPHEHLGYAMNFWRFVTRIAIEPDPSAVGGTLRQCHEVMHRLPDSLPSLAILEESLKILDSQQLFSSDIQKMLRDHLQISIKVLADYPHQPLHGDAHMRNVMNTTQGVLWTDWEDTFSGPVEWDVASVIWNAKLLDNDEKTVNAILDAYGSVDETAMHYSLIGRAAVMAAWCPILYPNPSEERKKKLQRRIDWLRSL